MIEHYAAAADANLPCARRDLADQHLGAGTGIRWRVVVFGNPVAMVARFVAELRQRQGIVQGFAGGFTVVDGALIENAEFERHGNGNAKESQRIAWQKIDK